MIPDQIYVHNFADRFLRFVGLLFMSDVECCWKVPSKIWYVMIFIKYAPFYERDFFVHRSSKLWPNFSLGLKWCKTLVLNKTFNASVVFPHYSLFSPFLSLFFEQRSRKIRPFVKVSFLACNSQEQPCTRPCQPLFSVPWVVLGYRAKDRHMGKLTQRTIFAVERRHLKSHSV